MVRKETTGTGQNRVRLPYNRLAPTPEKGNEEEGESTEEVKAKREAREARFQRKTIGYGKQTGPPREPLRGSGDLRVMLNEEYATWAASRNAFQDIPEGSGHPQDSQSGPEGAAEKKNYGPAFYASWAESRKAYQKAHSRRPAPDSPVPLPRQSPFLPPKRPPRDDRAVPKTLPESLPEWLSNVHLTAGGEQWYRPDLFRSDDPTRDDGKTPEKTSLEASTKMEKKTENARDGEGQPWANAIAFDRLPAGAPKEMHERHKGTHGDDVQSQTNTGSCIKTQPKGPKKMLDGISQNDPQNIWWSTNPVLLAPEKARVPDASTLEHGDNGVNRRLVLVPVLMPISPLSPSRASSRTTTLTTLVAPMR
jgi:hypothetical protein